MLNISLNPNQNDNFSTTENQPLKSFVRKMILSPSITGSFGNFTPLTQPFKDHACRYIQLWELKGYGLLGTVLDVNDILFIPKYKILSAISALEGDALIEKLQMTASNKWDLVFRTHDRMLLIWPHLEAAGRLGRDMPNGKFKYGDGLDGHRKNIFKLDSLRDAFQQLKRLDLLRY